MSQDIKRLYGLSALFLVFCLVAVYFQLYPLLLLPIAIVLGWVLVTKPKYSLYFLAFATPLSVHLIDERYSTVNLSIPTEPLIILLFIGVLLKGISAKTLVINEFKTILSVLIISDFAWMAMTAVTSTMPLISFKYVLMKSWYIVVFYFLSAKYFQKELVARKFLWALIASVVLLSMYTLFVHAGGGFSRAYAYTAMRPFLPDHGMYAACISFIVPVLFVFAVHGKTLDYSPSLRILCIVLFLFMGVAVALSFTRASWISLVVALGMYFLFTLKIRFKYVVLLGVFAIGALLSNMDNLLTDLSRNKNESDDNIENHLQSVSNVSSDPSNLERLNRWSSAIRMWEDKPVMGWGPGTYTFQYGQYQLPHQMTIISTNAGTLGGIHSEYLRPLAESGVIGALGFIVIVFWVFSMGFKHQRVLSGSAKYLSMAVFLGLVTYFTHAVLNNYSEFDKIAVPLYSFMAILTAIEIKYQNVQKDSKK
ncbi:O-antigen ligase family protein [Bacteroidia bacterium]|nr:O-antigen ligase family protein [Bacteroidia bacterium]MDB9881578.1 O-antigen ligase family protein [Bacteroidia bacterium]